MSSSILRHDPHQTISFINEPDQLPDEDSTCLILPNDPGYRLFSQEPAGFIEDHCKIYGTQQTQDEGGEPINQDAYNGIGEGAQLVNLSVNRVGNYVVKYLLKNGNEISIPSSVKFTGPSLRKRIWTNFCTTYDIPSTEVALEMLFSPSNLIKPIGNFLSGIGSLISSLSTGDCLGAVQSAYKIQRSIPISKIINFASFSLGAYLIKQEFFFLLKIEAPSEINKLEKYSLFCFTQASNALPFWEKYYLFTAAVILAPIVEEILFRGYIQTAALKMIQEKMLFKHIKNDFIRTSRFTRIASAALRILVTSVFFGSLHISSAFDIFQALKKVNEVAVTALFGFTIQTALEYTNFLSFRSTKNNNIGKSRFIQIAFSAMRILITSLFSGLFLPLLKQIASPKFIRTALTTFASTTFVGLTMGTAHEIANSWLGGQAALCLAIGMHMAHNFFALQLNYCALV